MWMRFNTKVRYLIKERSAKKLISSYIGIMIILASFSIIFVSAGLADPIPFFGDPDGGGNFLEDPEELEDPEKPEEPEDPEKPEELGEQVDTFEPIITTVTPKDKATINDRTPEIIATYSDDSGIDPSNITLKLNDEDVTPSAEVTDTTITYKPVLPASSNDYMVKLAVSDNFGNIAVKTWSFTLQRNN